MRASFTDVGAAARGRWPEILPALGVPAEALSRKHGPCPGCGGSDRFRYALGLAPADALAALKPKLGRYDPDALAREVEAELMRQPVQGWNEALWAARDRLPDVLPDETAIVRAVNAAIRA